MTYNSSSLILIIFSITSKRHGGLTLNTVEKRWIAVMLEMAIWITAYGMIWLLVLRQSDLNFGVLQSGSVKSFVLDHKQSYDDDDVNHRNRPTVIVKLAEVAPI